MADGPVPLSFFEWFGGIVFFASSAVFGAIFHRLGQEADARRAAVASVEAQMVNDLQELTRMLDALRNDYQQHRGDMLRNTVSKADLNESELRIAAKLDRMETRLTVLADRGALPFPAAQPP